MKLDGERIGMWVLCWTLLLFALLVAAMLGSDVYASWMKVLNACN